MWTRREAILAAAASTAMLSKLGMARTVEPGVPPADRELRVPVKGGSIYVRVNGDLNSGRDPIIMVHGGPGGALFQFFPALPLAKDRAIILYDQLDSGRSDAPNDPANWTVERFVSEIEAVRTALGLRTFHLLGHSWGGILANRYAAARPAGLQSLILQGAPLSDRRLKASVEALYAALPDGLGTILIKGDRGPAYEKAQSVFFKKHLGRTSMKSVAMPYMAKIPEDRGDAVANHIMGGKIHGFGGVLKGFDDEPLLARVRVPTLLLIGEFDLMTRASQEAVVGKLRRGRMSEIRGAGHMIQFDQPEAWRRAVRTFVAAHDKRAART